MSKTTRAQPKRKLATRAKGWPMPGSIFTDPNASVFTGKRDRKMPKLSSLPFVKDRPKKGHGRRCFWAVKPTGKYGYDCAIGQAYARLFLPFLKYNLGIAMLGQIVLGMIERGADEHGKGLVVGFMGEIARELSLTQGGLALFAAAATPQAPAFLKKAMAKDGAAICRYLGSVI
jgi:hypothetical protein